MSNTHALTARWLSLKQAAQYSGLTDRTLRNYAQAGLLTLHRIIQPGAARGTVRIDRLKLDALIEGSIAPASELSMNKAKQARTAKMKEQARFRSTQIATGGMEGGQS
jgi:hypothetical protein